jgi:hypothetical protein
MRAVAHAQQQDAADLDRQLGEMACKAAELGDPYAMSAYAMTALEANKPELAESIVALTWTVGCSRLWSVMARPA